MDRLTRMLYQAAGGLSAPTYVEDVFSTWLYTGNGSTRTITNEIDLAGQGGLVWIKSRTGTFNHVLYDTNRGASPTGGSLNTNNTDAQGSTTQLTAFNNNGFTLASQDAVNTLSTTYASWTFRKQAKFFDIVTYTGNGSNRTISHNLGSVPGCIIVKRTDVAADWQVYHRSNANTEYMVLNTTDAKTTSTARWNSTTPTSTVFSLGTDATVNASAGTYVAYLFAHNDAGFGVSGTDNVISCGSFTTDASGNATVALGYEPQWILMKTPNASSSWLIFDSMRGWTNGSTDAQLLANSSVAENLPDIGHPTSNGFQFSNVSFASINLIYIAIRRPNKPPTTGTQVFQPVATSSAANTSLSVGFAADLVISKGRTFTNVDSVSDRLLGFAQNNATPNPQLRTTGTAAETTANSPYVHNVNNTTALVGNALSGSSAIHHFFRRASSFFDIACYTGTGASLTVNHNLGLKPELMIIKSRNAVDNWNAVFNQNNNYPRLYLNGTNANTGLSGITTSNTQFTVPLSLSTGSSSSVSYSYTYDTTSAYTSITNSGSVNYVVKYAGTIYGYISGSNKFVSLSGSTWETAAASTKTGPAGGIGGSAYWVELNGRFYAHNSTLGKVWWSVNLTDWTECVMTGGSLSTYQPFGAPYTLGGSTSIFYNSNYYFIGSGAVWSSSDGTNFTLTTGTQFTGGAPIVNVGGQLTYISSGTFYRTTNPLGAHGSWTATSTYSSTLSNCNLLFFYAGTLRTMRVVQGYGLFSINQSTLAPTTLVDYASGGGTGSVFPGVSIVYQPGGGTGTDNNNYNITNSHQIYYYDDTLMFTDPVSGSPDSDYRYSTNGGSTWSDVYRATSTMIGFSLFSGGVAYQPSVYWTLGALNTGKLTSITNTTTTTPATTYVNYLFASCPNISKVGTYTGNGTSQTINCAFTTGARFVMIKRTDSTGDWYVWDSARGIVSGNDPHWSLNTLTTEVTTNDSIDPDNSGFIVNQVAATNINVTSATYLFLAIA